MVDEEQVARIKRSVDEWNQWRKQNFLQSCNLREANLDFADLSKADLSKADLIGAHLREANLRFANLSGAKLNRAQLSRAHLNFVHFRNVHLNGADLSFADLRFTDFIGADLIRAHLVGADLIRALLIRAHLREADLRFADLRFADLSGANLSRANLSGANFSGANLSGADLSDANLFHAELSDVNLRFANLSGADLSNAHLIGTKLSGAHLVGTHLIKADFTKSSFADTLFVNVDLSTIQGLGTSVHQGPSTININSVILPHDEPTRTYFLRGIGFTEQQIDYLPSLLTPRPIQYHSLFISYAHEDEELARLLSTRLRKKNVPCWFAPHDLQPGNYFRQHIDQAIHTQDKVLLLLSEHSVESGWVEYEVELALARENLQRQEILFPVRLDGAIFSCTASWAASLQQTRHIGDFTGWQDEQRYQEAFSLLLRHLKTEPSPPHSLS